MSDISGTELQGAKVIIRTVEMSGHCWGPLML